MASKVSCPCCRYLTLSVRGGYELCPVCFWIDDGGCEEASGVRRVMGTGLISLLRARENFAAFGACDPDAVGHVRPPRPWEVLRADDSN